MSEFGTDCTTSVGRIVWGSPTKPRPKKHRNGPQKGQPMIDATTGQPVQEISFGVAFPKADFTANIWPAMSAEIGSGYPNGVPPRFAYKYVDGDGPDDKGQPYSLREGYAGCFVLAYTQRINATFAPPSIFKFNPQSGRYDQLGPEDIKCGDFVAVGTNFKVHVATGTEDTPSIYVNPKGVELVGYGTAIVTAGAVDPNAMFAGRTHQLPAGASATPMANPNAPQMPGMGAPPAGQPQMPPPGGQPPMQPGYAPQPAPQPQGYQQPGQMPPPGGQPPMQPGYAPQPAPQGYPPPAHDFVQGAPQPQGYQQPGQMPPPGGQPPMQPGYAPQPAPQGYQQPGQMPGMMPGR